MMEFAALDHALERAEAGPGQVMALIGQASVGKSRRLEDLGMRPHVVHSG